MDIVVGQRAVVNTDMKHAYALFEQCCFLPGQRITKLAISYLGSCPVCGASCDLILSEELETGVIRAKEDDFCRQCGNRLTTVAPQKPIKLLDQETIFRLFGPY
ncbi:MAG: hypothetical protein WCQ00_03425 [bacterium]